MGEGLREREGKRERERKRGRGRGRGEEGEGAGEIHTHREKPQRMDSHDVRVSRRLASRLGNEPTTGRRLAKRVQMPTNLNQRVRTRALLAPRLFQCPQQALLAFLLRPPLYPGAPRARPVARCAVKLAALIVACVQAEVA